MRALLRRQRSREAGQAAVETAIVMPLMVFTILGIFQLTLLQQARLMLEYAAYNAARAGIVWNMNKDKMRTAATLSLMPTLPSMPFLPGALGHTQRVDSIPRLAAEYAKFYLINENVAQYVFDQKIVDIEVLNPKRADFGGAPEIEFDKTQIGFAQRRPSQLTIRATYLYELRVPFANWILFESWMAGNAGIALTGLNPAMPKIKMGFAEFETSAAARFLMESSQFKRNEGYTGLSQSEFMRLVYLALMGHYYMPLITTHTMRMQSNPYVDNTDS